MNFSLKIRTTIYSITTIDFNLPVAKYKEYFDQGLLHWLNLKKIKVRLRSIGHNVQIVVLTILPHELFADKPHESTLHCNLSYFSVPTPIYKANVRIEYVFNFCLAQKNGSVKIQRKSHLKLCVKRIYFF